MKYIFATLLMFVSLYSEARDYLPVLTEGKVWNCIFYCPFKEPKTYNFQIKVDGDTIAGDRTCKRIRLIYPKGTYCSYNTAAYEENHKVYSFNYENKETLLLDFDMEKGDHLYGTSYIYDVDSIEFDGVKRKRILLSLGYDEKISVCWIEGVGATSEYWATEVPIPTDGVSQYLESCYDNGKCIFRNENLPDNVTNGIGYLKAQQNCTGKNEIYNIMGCRVSNMSGHGVFIKNGKKIIR